MFGGLKQRTYTSLKRILQGLSFGRWATAHIMTVRYMFTATVPYVCFMDVSACRQNFMTQFYVDAVCRSGAWGPHSRIIRECML